MYQYPDYLMHYGIKGMKWGVRKQRVTSGKTKRRSSKGSMSEEDKKARRRRNAKIAAGVAGGVAGNSHYLRTDSPALLDAAERHASKVNKKKHEIWLREFEKQGTDSFPQAVKNTATYYKNRKRKRR